MLLEYLEQLRERPLHERRHFAIACTVILTAIIVLIWVSTLLLGRADTTTVETEHTQAPSATYQELRASAEEALRPKLQRSGSEDTSHGDPQTYEESSFTHTFSPEGNELQYAEATSSTDDVSAPPDITSASPTTPPDDANSAEQTVEDDYRFIENILQDIHP